MHNNNIEASLQLYKLSDVCKDIQNKIWIVIEKMEIDYNFIYSWSEIKSIENSIERLEYILDNIRI